MARKVILLMRTAAPGRYSLERVFADVRDALPPGIDAKIVRVPFDSRGVVPRLRNLAFTARLRADVIHVTGDVQYCALAVRRSRCLLTVLDFESLGQLRGMRKRAFFLFWYQLPTWWAAGITTISRATQQELVRLLPGRSAKTSVVPCSVGSAFLDVHRPARQPDLARVLQVGTAPHKNLERLVAAIAPLPVHLRIVGVLSDGQRMLLEESSLSFSAVEHISEDDLIREYLAGDVLVFVSTAEGFGIPILEAQAVGLPVITSNVSSMPEVAGEGALLVDPASTQAIQDAVASLLKSPELAQALVTKGHENVQSFLPKVVAARYADVYLSMELPS